MIVGKGLFVGFDYLIFFLSMVLVSMQWICGSLLPFMRQLPKQGKAMVNALYLECKVRPCFLFINFRIDFPFGGFLVHHRLRILHVELLRCTCM